MDAQSNASEAALDQASGNALASCKRSTPRSPGSGAFAAWTRPMSIDDPVYPGRDALPTPTTSFALGASLPLIRAGI